MPAHELALAALLVVGCGLFSPGGYSVATDILAEGPFSGSTPATAVVRTVAGGIIIEIEEHFPSPRYIIEASVGTEVDSSTANEVLLLGVTTERTSSDVIELEWVRKYRYTITSVPVGTYHLRLVWRNRFLAPAAQIRTLVDTRVAVTR